MGLKFNPAFDITLDDNGRDGDGFGTANLTVYNWDANRVRDNMHSSFQMVYGPTDTALNVAQGAAPWAFVPDDTP